MSKLALNPNASGTGTYTLASPANNASHTLTLPVATGTLLTDTGALPAANLTGSLPAINGSNLTSLSAPNLTGALPAIDGSSLTSLSAPNLTGALPAIDGSNLTGISAGGMTKITQANISGSPNVLIIPLATGYKQHIVWVQEFDFISSNQAYLHTRTSTSATIHVGTSYNLGGWGGTGNINTDTIKYAGTDSMFGSFDASRFGNGVTSKGWIKYVITGASDSSVMTTVEAWDFSIKGSVSVRTNYVAHVIYNTVDISLRLYDPYSAAPFRTQGKYTVWGIS